MTRWGEFTPGVLPGQTAAPTLQDSPQQARVLSVTAGGVTFELDATPGHAYGPAPWLVGSYASAAAAISAGFAPHVGDRCLVVFAGTGMTTPWISAWAR